jgi:hypothetical protein
MNVTLEAIKFNHVPESATVDAFNIRRNETEPVHVPEWRKGISVKPEDSPAAYAISETRGNTLTIKAKFKSTGPGSPKVQVRAVQAREQLRQSLGCSPIGLVLRAFSTARTAPVGNVLGVVKERQITFNAAGETDFVTFELSGVRLWSVGVSASTTNWRWQFRAKRSDKWTDFALTSHRIYTVLEVPKEPWEQTPWNDTNTQVPWAEAMEFACDWAAGAHDPDDAASWVTQSIHDLGLRGVIYSGSSFYTCPNFNCTQFLALLRGETDAVPMMNCSDCATAVSSFANLVGSNLKQLQLGPSDFLTKPIKLLGFPQESPDDFLGHEVAWKGSVTEDGQLFDACLQVDGDDQPEAAPFVPLLPANIPFGRTGEKHYRFRLSPNLFIKPNTLICRKIGYEVEGDCRQLDVSQLEFLKLRYGYATWNDLAPQADLLSIDYDFLGPRLLPGWTPKLPVQQPRFAGSVKAFQLLWLFPEDKNVLLRLDLVEWKTRHEAREFMLRELGEFHLFRRVKRLSDPSIGDVSFVEAGDVSILFARSQLVFLVRSAGRKPIAVRQIAMTIDKLLVETASAKITKRNDSDS